MESVGRIYLTFDLSSPAPAQIIPQSSATASLTGIGITYVNNRELSRAGRTLGFTGN